ncbi:hypothetical protein [Microcoleus sp. FACHB-672]|uniref:hypothetical protein n=1 Tax=Microcoleus sp. FACHB-672 TaxID=2692825 RepID=UPI001686D01D|nr:hypothetical protein [Microcoleus sp. FACHB-672]MBD2040179.1 hypothetical protein [Microcoleus sp. FACHB-672]
MSNTGDGKKLATFNVEAELWEAFKNKARDNGTNASALLNQYLKNYLDDLDGVPSTNLGSTRVRESEPTNDESLIDRLEPRLVEKIKAQIEHGLGELVNSLIDANLSAAVEAQLGKE